MIAYLPFIVFTIAAALALGSIHASLRDAMRKAPLLARQIERIEQ